MYEKHYGLKEKPFTILPDPDFLYWGRTHQLAFAMLEYGIVNGAGITVITGEIGCGKTTLIRHLLNRLDDTLQVGLLSNVQTERGGLLNWVLHAFDQPHEGDDHITLFKQLETFLRKRHKAGRRTVLIVDEAQNLSLDMLEELRLLTNIHVGKRQLLQLSLLGQPQLKDVLRRPELVQFTQRVASDFHIRPLREAEVGRYIETRLAKAGRKEPLFEAETFPRIHRVSRGIPRLINIICDTALVYGYSSDNKMIGLDIINEVVSDKSKYGVFSYYGRMLAPKAATPEFEISKEGEGPALVIHDRKLAEYILTRLKDTQ